MIYKFFDKISKGSCFKKKIKGIFCKIPQLANELHKPIIGNFKKRKVHSSFKDNIWGVDLADTQLISKFNKKLDIFDVLLICSVNILGLKGVSIVNAFSKHFKKVY